jgi:hypothetical protein
MIHHLSIAALDARRVAEVLAEFMGGEATRFPPNPGSWFAHQDDAFGTGVEVYPSGTELHPEGFAMSEPGGAGYGPTHFALSVKMSPDAVAAIAAREGWRRHRLQRGGPGGFHVMEVWIENRQMVEILPPAFAAEYLKLARTHADQPA